jgi:hypothetical protein
MFKPISFDIRHLSSFANHPYVESFVVRPTSDRMEFEFLFKPTAPMSKNIHADAPWVYVEFTNASYSIYWQDRENGPIKKQLEASNDKEFDHLSDAIMNIVDFIEVITEDERWDDVSEQSYALSNPFAFKALKIVHRLINGPTDHPDRWARTWDRFKNVIEGQRRVERFPFKR